MHQNINISTFLNGKVSTTDISVADILNSTPTLIKLKAKRILEEFNYPVSPDSYLFEDSHNYQIIDTNT